MSVCGAEEDSGSEEPCGPSGGPLRDMRRRKSPSKVLRLLTVLAYLLSVSLAAILLSIYYVYVWKSPQVPVEAEHRVGCRSHLRSGRKDCIHFLMKGGSNSTVKVNSTGTSDTTTALTTENVDEASTEPTASSLPTSTSLPSSPSQLPQARQSPGTNTNIAINT